MDNRKELEDKIYESLVRHENHTVFIKECADVAIQYTIDVLREVGDKASYQKQNTYGILRMKYAELQSLLKKNLHEKE